MRAPLRFTTHPAHTTSQFGSFTAKSVQPARRSGGWERADAGCATLFFRAAEVYILSQYCGVKRVSTRRSRFSVKPVGHSHYGTHSRWTRWLTAQSRSEVTVTMLRSEERRVGKEVKTR